MKKHAIIHKLMPKLCTTGLIILISLLVFSYPARANELVITYNFDGSIRHVYEASQVKCINFYNNDECYVTVDQHQIRYDNTDVMYIELPQILNLNSQSLEERIEIIRKNFPYLF